MTDVRGIAGERRAAMALLSRAEPALLESAVIAFGTEAQGEDLKPPQTGLVMVRGRIGGNGAAFNVGEATVARAVVRLQSGVTGFGFRLGRDALAARHAALLDALWQTPEHRVAVEERALAPTRERLDKTRAAEMAAAAASRVEFFTMAREAT